MAPNQHIILISEQPMPNLIPIIAQKPKKVHLLVSGQMSLQGARIKAFLQKIGIESIQYSIDPYNMEQVENICNQIIEPLAVGEISLNATGGTKVAAFGAFTAFSRASLPVFYFDPAKWEIISLDKSGKAPIKPDVEISVADYLALHGKNVIKVADDDELLSKRRALTAWLVENLPQSGIMPVLNEFATDAQSKKVFPFSQSFDKRFNQSFYPILERLAKEAVINWDKKSKTVTFANIANAAYIGGFWLEEYVYDVVKSLDIYDVKRNVVIKWDESGITNEFDVVFTKKCRLFVVSCKTSKLGSAKQYKEKNPVYELDSLKDDSAGLFGKGILVSASPLGDELHKRADTLKLITISSDNLKQWLKKKLEIAIR